jgi:phosphoserine phosphatase
MLDWQAAVAMGIGLAVVVIAIILILCVWGGEKLMGHIDASEDRQLSAKRDAEERGILVGEEKELKEKIGIIISPLEGFLTESDTFWNVINAELGLAPDSESSSPDPSSARKNHAARVRNITSKWMQAMKDSPYKFNKQVFDKFYQKYLKVRDGAKEFIAHCMENYEYHVISEAPWEFCLLAKEKLGFYHYHATSLFIFDSNKNLNRIIAHPQGFQTEKLMNQIIKRSIFGMKETIGISNTERDITMLNQAGFGVQIGLNIPALSSEAAPSSTIMSLSDIDFEELKVALDRITANIKQAKSSSIEVEA